MSHNPTPTPAQRLSRVIYDSLKLRGYVDTIRRASEQASGELGQSFGFAEVADDCLPLLDGINEELTDIHCSLIYKRSDEGPDPAYRKALETFPRIVEHALEAAHQRAARHRPLLEGVPAVAAYLHCVASDMYFHLDVVAPIEARLNRPPRDLRYEPLTVQFLPSEVIEIRRHCIAKAVANGQIHSEFYNYSDTHDWRFRYTAVPLYGAEEVLCVVEDAEDWQLGFWQEREAG